MSEIEESLNISVSVMIPLFSNFKNTSSFKILIFISFLFIPFNVIIF